MANPYRMLSLGMLGVFGTALGASLLGGHKEQTPAPPPPLLPEAHAAPLEVVHHEKLRHGHTLAELFRQLRVADAQARAILAQLPDSARAAEVREGREYDFRVDTRTGGVRRMTLQLDADRILHVDARKGLRARLDSVEVHTDTAVFFGTVHESLYEALSNGHGDIPRRERQQIAEEIAEKIFETKIDFSNDLNDGDTYQILYERTVRPDNSARRSRLLAVRFLLGGHLYDAFLFKHDGAYGWYDRKGESLRRGFLRAPVDFRRISSGFSLARFHPILHRIRAHVGIDFAAAPGTPVRAVADGVVRRAGWSGGYGNLIELGHPRGYSTRYGHLRAFAKGVRDGARVKQGQVIGYVGMTGLATGPHLHYEFRENGRPVNPATVRSIQGEPVDAGADSRFREVIDARLAAMERAGAVRLAENGGRSRHRRAE